MKNDKYWKKRFSQLEAAQNKIGTDAYSEIESIYRQAQKTIEGQITSWYQRFADNNNITLAEARQYLKGADLNEFKWTVNDYIQYGEQNAEYDGIWAKQLENASAKFHVSKLEELKMEVQNSLETVFAKQSQIATSALGDAYQSGYYHTAYELQKGFNIGFDIASINQSEIEKLLSKPWAVDGYNFSEKIWNNKDKLISTIHNELTQNIMLGKDPQVAIDAIAKQMNTSKNNAGRLVMTEEAYFSSLAQQDCFHDLGVEEYEILATLDSHTSDICRGMDGKVFPMAEFEAGVTAPPFHPWCRSTTVPHFADNFGQIGERAARDEDGNLYYVPDNMNYQDWKATFVDGGDKSDFAVYDENGVLHYKKNEPEEPPKPKKEYLTENKLKQKIADDDVKIDELIEQANQMLSDMGEDYDYSYIVDSGGFDAFYVGVDESNQYYQITDQMADLEEKYGDWGALMDHGSDEDILLYDKLEDEQIKLISQLQSEGFNVDSFGNIDGITKDEAAMFAEQKAKLEDIQNQIQAVEAEKADYQEKLDQKLVAKEKKNLTKQEKALEAEKADLQKQLDEFEIKTYSGIWKNDVTTADYADLNIEGKKEYYQKGIDTGKAGDKIDQYNEYLKELDELEKEGASYQEIQDKIKEIESQIEQIEGSLTALDNEGIIALSNSDDPFSPDAYSQDRKDGAYWFQYDQKANADEVMRPISGQAWQNSSRDERFAAYDYTSGSGGFNRPMRGYDRSWSNFKGVGKVPLNNEGKGEEIIQLANIIDKSSYNFDIWMNRGIETTSGAASFLGISESVLRNSTEKELQELLVGKVVKDEAFVSCGTAKGAGFNGYIFNIYAPRGTKMLYAEPFSAFGYGGKSGWDGVSKQSSFGAEFETIIQRGTQFRVTKVEKRGGNFYFDVEVVGQP